MAAVGREYRALANESVRGIAASPNVFLTWVSSTGRATEETDRHGIVNGTSGAATSSCNDGHVAPVTRLVTFVDVADARRMSVSARHEAVLVNGRRVLLLDDRGWSASGPPNIWSVTSVEEIVDTARMVVGPDEPFGGRSHDDMAADHWAQLTEVLRQQGLVADALELKRLPHDVVLSERLLARVGHDPGAAVQP